MNELVRGALERLLAAVGLPDPLPTEPIALLRRWSDEAAASGTYDDPNAMALATADAQGAPSVRMVLCKAISDAPPGVTFYTNFDSRKGHDLAANPRASVAFHWPHARRQVRIEGRVERLPDADSDAYFSSRATLARLGAWASLQSRPMVQRTDLVEGVIATAQRFGVLNVLAAGVAGKDAIPRPPHWGGFRLVAHRVEFWVNAGAGRLHDRAEWSRRDGAWHAQRLYP